MLIECPICKTRAQLPDDKEGAKVRCGECGRIYVAEPPGARHRARRRRSSSGVVLGMSVSAALLLAIVFVYRRGRSEAEAAEEAARAAAGEAAPESLEEAPALASLGWDAESVQSATRLHEAVFAFDENRVKTMLHGPSLWRRETGAEDTGGYAMLPRSEQIELLQRYANELVRGPGRELVGGWRAYDGEVLELSEKTAHVRLSITPRDQEAGGAKGWIDWRLVHEDGRWLAWSWERWEPAVPARKPSAIMEDKTTLSDGSVVLERDPKPMTHLEDTPPELREQIDVLVATMLDLDLTTEAADAQHELVEIGRPAIPILLNGLYQTPLDTEDGAIQINLLDQTLQRISGESMGYEPQERAGSSLGTTRERRVSAVRQWFSWWYRKGDDFQKKEVADGLEGQIELTEKEQRWLDRNPD